MFSSPLQMTAPGRAAHVAGRSVDTGERLYLQGRVADFQAVSPPVKSYLETAQAVEQIFDLVAVTEMQDETQKASATSSPDPSTLDGPQDRDIDVSHFLPSPADSYGALLQS
ncbi:uncharacterized protein L3040_004401 [Drepanopeziza brunnea f. sp. 'multigermtubi']|uniref:uncharacterized protein n=1 Tax=Drepanopeziza brunnea f. sp. 'multigermtubi' TaxID=698441 RepID=UPI0023A68A43|nr:hypothetical protein L3040_004401 [Drepanopeziza brunnea f. sp. 'multigermtubi']